MNTEEARRDMRLSCLSNPLGALALKGTGWFIFCLPLAGDLLAATRSQPHVAAFAGSAIEAASAAAA